MTVVHVVLFEFSPTANHKTIVDACESLLALKDKCLHPDTGKPYMLSSKGGRDMSVERHQRGMTHGFVMEFENEKDRDYYVHKDEAHQSFVKSLEDVVMNVTVIDFVPDQL